MTDYADPKRATARKAVIESLRAAANKRLIQRDKFDHKPMGTPTDTRKNDAPAERHRAWLRQAVRRDK
jgi:hypothetical protein